MARLLQSSIASRRPMQDPAVDVSQSFRVAQPDAARALTAELIDVADLPQLRAAWRDLYERSLEPNIFLDPDFALPALTYLHPQGLKMLVVFGAEPERRLLALAPVIPPRLPFGASHIHMHKQAALGLPLLDRAVAAAALAKLVEAVKSLPARPGALVFSDIPRDGPTYRLLCEIYDQGRLHLLGRYDRAALFVATDDRQTQRKSKGEKNSFRRLRRLSEKGAVSYRILRGADVAAAMAEFLALERSGWKGASKTALASAPARATFAKGMAMSLANAGKLWIESLDLDGKAVAMGILMKDGDSAYFWKAAYDEAHAALSPGVLLTREVTNRLMASRSPLRADSCAAPNHPMIDHLWPQRVVMLDLGLILVLGGHIALTAERLRRGLRKMIKSLLQRSGTGKALIGGTLFKTWRARS